MLDLKEIMLITTKRYLKKTFMFNASASWKQGNRYKSLMDGIISGAIKSDEEAATFIGLKPNSSGFRTFRGRMKERLINTLMLFTPDIVPHKQNKAMVLCLRNQYACEILRIFHGLRASFALAKETVPKALEGDLWEQALYFAKIVKMHAANTSDIALYNEYSALVKKFTSYVLAEEEVRDLYQEITINYMSNVDNPFNSALIERTNVYLQRIEEIKKEYDTFNTNVYYYRLKGMDLVVKKDFNAAIEIWDVYEIYLQNKGMVGGLFLREVSLQQMGCYMHLRDYESGKKCAEKGIKLFPRSSVNWYLFMEYYFLLLVHSRNYKEAGDVALEVLKDPRFKLQYQHLQEKWKIIQGYAYLITGRKDLKVRVKKVVNETPVYVKDKQGYNVTLLFLQIAYLILNDQYAELTGKIDALRRYSQRYLKRDASYRSYLFLQLIMAAESVHFEYNKVLIKSDKIIKKLNTADLKYSGTVEDLEVIPFEDLWQILLDKMKGESKIPALN